MFFENFQVDLGLERLCIENIHSPDGAQVVIIDFQVGPEQILLINICFFEDFQFDLRST